MNLILGNHVTTFEGNTEEKHFLGEYLSWRDTKADRWGVRHWNSVFDQEGETFPAGLAGLVARKAKERGFVVSGSDSRTKPTGTPRPIPGAWNLRSYQSKCVEVCTDLKRSMSGRGVVSMPTASGKTRVLSAIAWSQPGNWIMLVDTKDLLHQGAEAYEQLTGESAGRVGDGIWRIERFTVCTMQTLLDRFKSKAVRSLLKATDGFLIDEVHVAATKGYSRLLAASDAFWRLGFSATPFGREDKKDLLMVGLVGPLVYHVSPAELQAAGVTARAEIEFVKYLDEAPGYFDVVEKIRQDKGTESAWPVAYDLGIVKSINRNDRIVGLLFEAAYPALVFIKSIDHGRSLLSSMLSAGIRAEFISGKDASAARKTAVKRLERGDLDVLVCSTVFNKGVNIPAVLTLVNAAGGRSVHQTIQKLGRGTRAFEGKEKVTLYDFQDNLPFLKSQARARAKAYEDYGYAVVFE